MRVSVPSIVIILRRPLPLTVVLAVAGLALVGPPRVIGRTRHIGLRYLVNYDAADREGMDARMVSKE